MKTAFFAAAAFLALGTPAFAQSNPTANATTLGTATTSGNGAGAPSASTPAGQVSSAGGGSASPQAVPSVGTSPANAPPTADSSTTGTTTAPK